MTAIGRQPTATKDLNEVLIPRAAMAVTKHHRRGRRIEAHLVEALSLTRIYRRDGMTIAKTRTFRSGNSEAMRLSKDVAFGEGVELVVGQRPARSRSSSSSRSYSKTSAPPTWVGFVETRLHTLELSHYSFSTKKMLIWLSD